MQYDRDRDNIIDSSFGGYNILRNTITSRQRSDLIAAGQYDTLIENKDKWASSATSTFAIAGGDIGIPIIKTSLLGIDLYGQAATRLDSVRGFGFGAPGVIANIWKLRAQVEYRSITGQFTPGYFGSYYQDERIVRSPEIMVKSRTLPTVDLAGIFGSLGCDIVSVLTIDGSYTHLNGNNNQVDRRFEASAKLGQLVVSKVPKLRMAETYLNKTAIPRNQPFFEKTPALYYGYRVGIGLSENATLIADMRYGFIVKDGKTVPHNGLNIETAMTF
jgi:hypothetical protein